MRSLHSKAGGLIIAVKDYALAASMVAFALAIVLLLGPLIGPNIFPLFLAAVMLSAYIGGWGPGLLATILSSMICNFFFFEPLYSFAFTDLGSLTRLVTFMIAAVLISSLVETRRRAEQLLQSANEELEARVAERTAQLQETNAQLQTELAQRKRLEHERLALERRLMQSQRLESLALMAGGIAHDFNNLLAVIRGNTNLLLLDLPPDSPLREEAGQIDMATRQATDLTRQFLTISGRSNIATQPLDLNRLLQDFLPLLQATATKLVAIDYRLTPNLPAIAADETQIRQIVLNLVLNGAEAINKSGGAIVLTTSLVQADRTYLDSSYLGNDQPEGSYVRLDVSDTGCGMEETTLAKIFDPFFTTKAEGHGLGLATVVGIVRGHNGALNVQSTPGQGTIFSLLFPCVEERTESPVLELPTHAEAKASGDVVLIVDDEESVRHTVGQMLQRLGYHTLLAADGLEGIALFQAHAEQVSCILLDVTMPQMSGLEALQAIRTIEADVPIILMSGYSKEAIIQHDEGLAAVDFLAKPFSLTELEAKLCCLPKNWHGDTVTV